MFLPDLLLVTSLELQEFKLKAEAPDFLRFRIDSVEFEPKVRYGSKTSITWSFDPTKHHLKLSKLEVELKEIADKKREELRWEHPFHGTTEGMRVPKYDKECELCRKENH